MLFLFVKGVSSKRKELHLGFLVNLGQKNIKKLAFIIKTGHRSAGCVLDYLYVYNMKILSDTTYRIVTMDKNYRTKLRFYEKGKLKKTEILKIGAGNDYLGIER